MPIIAAATVGAQSRVGQMPNRGVDHGLNAALAAASDTQ